MFLCSSLTQFKDWKNLSFLIHGLDPPLYPILLKGFFSKS